jgi:hypothetical protein
MHSSSSAQRLPMIARNPRRAWPLLVAVGLPAAAFVGSALLLSRVEWPSRTWSVFAVVGALAPWIRAAYLALLGPHRAGAALWGLAGVVLVGLGVLADSVQTANQLPPGWPAGVPRYPCAWTGRGSVEPGQRAWFVRQRVGRASPHEVTYEAAYPHIERLSFGAGDGCTTFLVDARRLRVCPDGKNEVVVSLDDAGSRDARR